MTRLLSGIVLVAVLLLFGFVGGDLLLAGLCIISLIGLFELYRVCGFEKKVPAAAGYAMTMFYYLGLRFLPLSAGEVVFVSGMVLMILCLSVYVFTFPKYKAPVIMTSYFGFFYVVVMLSCIYLTRMLDKGIYLIWLIFLCSWGCDTCAYCTGVLIGKHKMAPVLSPKKSVEGAIGGVVGAFLLTLLYGMLLKDKMSITDSKVVLLALIGAAGGLISMVGDLAASAIKRNYEIKDYGRLIPGHGGILDRFDSVIITAPIVYLLSVYFL